MTATTAQPRNATPPALRYTRAEIIEAARAAREAGTWDSAWSVIAANYTNEWIRPGDFLACVAGPGSGVIGVFDLGGDKTKADAVARVRRNLPWYPSGWIVTSEGAERVFDLPALTGEICPSTGYDGRRRLYGSDILPFDAVPGFAYGGPAKVVADGWSSSYTTGGGIAGARLGLRRVNKDGTRGEAHELDGRTYPSVHDAERAAYEAGATLFCVKESDRLMYGLH